MMTNQLVQLMTIEIKSLGLHNNIYNNIYNNSGGEVYTRQCQQIGEIQLNIPQCSVTVCSSVERFLVEPPLVTIRIVVSYINV